MTERYRERQKDNPGTTGSFTSRYAKTNWSAEQEIEWVTYFSFDSERDYMWDRKTPGYFKAKREGTLLPVSPYRKQKYSVFQLPGNGEILTHQWNSVQDKEQNPGDPKFIETFVSNGCLGRADWFEQVRLLQPPRPSDVSDLALQAALARAQTDAWDTATFLAELGKTVEGLATIYPRWMSICERVLLETRGLNTLKSKHERLQAYSEAWLEARYMWRPLMYDIKDMYTAYQRLVQGIENPLARGWETRVGSPTRDVLSFSSRTPSCVYWDVNQIARTAAMPWPQNGFNMVCQGVKERELIARAAVGVQVSTRTETMFDPAVTAWELVPFSFVLDWFVNIGEAIAAFSPFATGTLAFATLTVTERETVSLTGSAFAQDIPEHWSLVRNTPAMSEFSLISETKIRSLPTNVTPNLGFDVALDAFKITDLVALWLTRNRSFMRRLLNRR